MVTRSTGATRPAGGCAGLSSRLIRRAKPNVPTQVGHALRLLLALQGAVQRGEQAGGVPGRAQQVRGLLKTRKLVSRNQRHVRGAAPRDDDRLAIRSRAVAQAREVCAGLRIGRLYRHDASTLCTGLLYSSPHLAARGGALACAALS